MTIEPKIDFSKLEQKIIDFSTKNNEPNWLLQKRRLALFQLQNNKLSGEDAELVKTLSASFLAANPQILDKSTEELTNSIDQDLFVAARNSSQLLQESLMEKAMSWQASPILAAHLAFLTAGRFIYLPPKTILKDPIIIKNNTSNNEHILIIIGEGVQIDIIEQINSTVENQSYLGTELLIAPNAQVNYYQANNFSTKNSRQAVQAYQAQDSNLQMYGTLFESVSTKSSFKTELNGRGSVAQVNTIALADDEQRQDITVKVENLAPNTNGEIIQHGVVNDQAHLKFHATGRITKGSKQSKSQQTSRLLTLTDHCTGEVDPILLIEENDVIAGHAASVGQVDAAQLYYLQVRGLSKKAAEILLIKGFLKPVLDRFPDEELQQKIQQRLEQRLKIMEQIDATK